MAEKLKLTDRPNVAQVIRIYKELDRQRDEHRYNWLGRILLWCLTRRGDVVTLDRDNAQILEASRKMKRIDAAGNVVDEEPAPAADIEPAKPRLVEP